jgi:hypothetical protein
VILGRRWLGVSLKVMGVVVGWVRNLGEGVWISGQRGMVHRTVIGKDLQKTYSISVNVNIRKI